MGKAMIAMSGGVDSSVAAYLMKQRGYDCVGVTMKLFHNEDAGISKGHTCCSLDDVEDARSVAFRLGMPYYVCNYTGDFKAQVIDRFVRTYEAGATPNPCLDCNRFLKFDKLLHRAKELDCDLLVTGHYARIETRQGRHLLKKAVDPTKDQSYVLYFLSQAQLAHLCFPLGEMEKSQARTLAREQGLINAAKPDSQDICFVPDGDYAAIVSRHSGKAYPSGSFEDPQGRVLGTHGGIVRYTIGQRRGLGISAPNPLYVCRLDVARNAVVLAGQAELFSKELVAEDVNWIAFDAPPSSMRVKARIRYQQPEQWATVESWEDGTVKVVFDEPQRAITPGQAVVFYDDDVVLGGGTICPD